MVGRKLTDFYPDKSMDSSTQTQLKLTNFDIPYEGSDFKRLYTIAPMNLELKKGEVLGIAGLEGLGFDAHATGRVGAEWRSVERRGLGRRGFTL